MSLKKILFISHDANRTGAPILLLNFVRWLKEAYPEYDLSIIIDRDGPLCEDFKKYATIFQLNRTSNLKIKRLNKLIEKNYEKALFKKINRGKWKFIFSNTIINGKILEKINTEHTPVFSYIHELENTIKYYGERNRVAGTLQKTDYFFCGSQKVQFNLIKNCKIKIENTSVVYSFMKLENEILNKEKGIRLELNIPDNALVVAMMGTFDWRKGNDIFIKTCLENKNKNIYFIWIGVDNIDDYERISYDLQKYQAKPNLILLPSSADYKKYFNLIDIFYLSSREDPYPLVMVDAANYGIPIICFRGAGGTEEFIEDFGYIAEYGNTTEVNTYLEKLEKNRNLLKLNRDYIIKKSAKNHDIEFNSKQIIEKIEEVITDKSSRI